MAYLPIDGFSAIRPVLLQRDVPACSHFTVSMNRYFRPRELDVGQCFTKKDE